MVDCAVQLYTLRGLDASVPERLELVADAGFDGVEFAYRVREESPEAVREALDRTGLDAAAAHVSIDALEDDYAATTDFYDRLGVDLLVIPWLDPSRFETAATVDAVATRLSDLAAALDRDGFRLAYHTHDHEFVALGGGSDPDASGTDPDASGTALDALLARTDERLGFEPDAGWAAVAGVDPAALIDRYADRITHVHVADADVDRGASVALGEGDVDLDAVVASARAADAAWLVYEHDDPRSPRSSIERGAAALRDALR
ncbi:MULTISPECIES: sugar phosphate isomerase/epimerase family protein [Halorubrum]|uniref:Xylose isomerase domain-containing protein n=1 Tax=Halorubrum hochstenium ATCC 700873 TaxID=1227481 RepID=M0F4E9_9EURY|nr:MULTISPECIES: sugar phosphate isomerase/epimerase [Halorubrum]ELZ54047.1 xylose isomerase domain-containing protein [Halorubrum hochstenium ATCC 700873]